MELSEHVQYIIHSAKTITYARDYDAVEPDHIMYALFMDENDLPKIILEKIGLDNPRLIRDFSANIPKKAVIRRSAVRTRRFQKTQLNFLKTRKKKLFLTVTELLALNIYSLQFLKQKHL